MKFSAFNVSVRKPSSVLVKNMLTGAIFRVPNELFEMAQAAPLNLEDAFATYGAEVAPFVEHGLVVESEVDEFELWFKDLMKTRNDKAHLFSMYFLPTIQCQLRCNYCFENGGDRGVAMTPEILDEVVVWLSRYLAAHCEVDQLRMVLFGGEPLLRSDICITALQKIYALCMSRGVEFWSELITNGELLTEEVAAGISRFNWRRVQITLDGPEKVHNNRRPGVNGRKTFRRIIENVRMLLRTEHISSVDLRLSFDLHNCDEVINFLDELSAFGAVGRINLSLGFITDTFVIGGDRSDPKVAEKALEFWNKAKQLGFAIPETQFTGPLCVATAKHSAVILPDGGLQKCFATAGRKEYNFSTVKLYPVGHTQDHHFEQWKRMDECIAEKCVYLPVCGGGCPHDAMVANGGIEGSSKRYCQKGFLDTLNKGLVNLAFSE